MEEVKHLKVGIQLILHI